MRISSVAAVCLTLMIPAVVRADTASHFGGGNYSDVADLLNTTGIGAGNAGSEVTTPGYLVPGTFGQTEVTFTWLIDRGSFKPSFGYFVMDGVTADPLSDPQGWATQALTNATVLFDERVDSVGDSKTFNIDAGEEIVFFLVPNNTWDNFIANPASFYPSNAHGDKWRSPLFSYSDANPGQYDQLLQFVAGDLTLLAWEDKTRAGASDHDFNDVAFTLFAQTQQFVPDVSQDSPKVPEPATLALSTLVVGALLIGRRR